MRPRYIIRMGKWQQLQSRTKHTFRNYDQNCWWRPDDQNIKKPIKTRSFSRCPPTLVSDTLLIIIRYLDNYKIDLTDLTLNLNTTVPSHPCPRRSSGLYMIFPACNHPCGNRCNCRAYQKFPKFFDVCAQFVRCSGEFSRSWFRSCK